MKRILFIEDESALQKTLGDMFKEQGYEMISAIDGEIGLRLANPADSGKKPELILLDLILPKLSGLEVLKQLKENPETKNIPVIILTNLEDIENVEKALSLGATTYLVKANYTLEELLGKIKKALEGLASQP